MGLVGRVDPVGAGDRLQEGVFLQRLVQVLRLQDRRIESGEQFRRDDGDLERVGWIVESGDHLFQLLGAGRPRCPRRRVGARLRHHDGRRIGREHGVEGLLVGHT